MSRRAQVRGRPPAEPRSAAGCLARLAGREEAPGLAAAAGRADAVGDAGPASGTGDGECAPGGRSAAELAGCAPPSAPDTAHASRAKTARPAASAKKRRRQ